MKSALRQFGLAMAGSSIWTVLAAAAPLAEYQYDPVNLNPNTQGWTWSTKGTLTDNAEDAALNVDQIVENAPYFTADVGAANLADPSGWTLTGRVRVNTISPEVTVGARYGVVLAVDTGTKWWNVSLFKDGTSNDGAWSGFTPTQLAPVDDMDVFHTFQLIDNDGLDTTAPNLFIDGVDTGMLAIDGGTFTPPGRVWWGSGSSAPESNADWQYVAFEVGQHPVSPQLIGDLNDDGFVGQDDLNIILGGWGTHVAEPGNWMQGDPSNDGFVGQDDLNDVLGGWGQGTPPAAFSAVPEPQSFLLAIIGIGAWLALRRRK